MRIIIISAVGLSLLFSILFGIYFFKDKTIETAISEFDDHDYIESIEILNKLEKSSNYESSEKIFFYKCRAINKLATSLEEDYSDELKETILENKGTEGFRNNKKEIETELEYINKKINGDLYLSISQKKSHVLSGGKFYDEFIAKYRGSSLIEDLNFEQLKKVEKTNPAKLLQSMIAFYNQYPNTSYISQVVKILFDNFKNNNIKFSENKDIVWDMIVSYVQRYPTSPETSKLFTLKGDNVNLRNSPGLEGQLVGKIKKDEIIIQLEKSMDTSQIGDVRDYWYKISTLNGLRGWIFGKFLKSLDTGNLKRKIIEEKWTMNENFSEWTDSNTPSDWSHIKGAENSSISFKKAGKVNIAVVNSAKGKSSGLYSRFNSSRAFKIFSRAKLTNGEGFTLFSFVIGKNKVFYIELNEEEINVCGRVIPIHTTDWHEYLLESENGQFAKLHIDGEVVSGRIKPVKVKIFEKRGIYILHSKQNLISAGEMEFIKVK